MHEKFSKPYNPKESENAMYAKWENSGFFNPDNCIKEKVCDTDAEPFSIVLPPPNVTGTLHMGHAAMLAVEDILIRYQRMRGRKTLWVPGTDHAAIATQAKVEKDLFKKEKKTRHDLGREEFLKRVEAFARESHDSIVFQIKAMGSSVDWSREAYTLDEKRGLAVRTAFKNMYDDGLIYRGARIINWDPKMQTTVSDEEIEWIEQETPFYYLKYGPFIIATTRPETKFGDKYVVMHPDDARYKEYTHGQTIEVEWINGAITATIIKDEAIDMELGTGVMTITPWHDVADFDIAQRHNLDKEQIINEKGLLLPIAGEFSGEHIKKARPRIVEKLKERGLLEKVEENYKNRIATNSRGGGTIEPQIKLQWFIDVNKPFTLKKSKIDGIKSGDEVTLKTLMRVVVESSQIGIIPDHFKKTYFHWIDNLRDWCISRQIWYGHRIPVWYKDDKIHVDINAPMEDGWEQDPDTLDTWFSSGLWSFSTLGWPAFADKAMAGKPGPENDLANYHPTSVLETGYDILFFWIARMILMSGYHLGEIPFKTVYLHGLVRDEKGKKMSKSLGNVIDPLDMIEKYGADATRLSLIVGATPGTDIKLSEEKVRGYKHFANKIWNITRFVLQNTDNIDLTVPYTQNDQIIWNKFRQLLVKEITNDIENYRLHLAAEKIYHYVWHEFADKIIEHSKTIFAGEIPDEHGPEFIVSRKKLLYSILTDSLKLLHPFTPFVTEEIWSHLPQKNEKLLMIESWPTSKTSN